MTLYERITGGVSESLKKAYGRADFIVDIPKTNVGFDLYSNILKITGKEIQINDFDGFVEKISFENGFLNIKLKEEVLIEFLFDFEPSISETDSDVARILSTIQRLAEESTRFSRFLVWCSSLSQWCLLFTISKTPQARNVFRNMTSWTAAKNPIR